MDKRDLIAEHNPNALLINGFDDALIGYVVCYDEKPLTLAFYDAEMCIEVLMEDDMTEDEALEYFDYNIIGAYMGVNTPVFRPFFYEEEEYVGKVLSFDGGFKPDEIHLFEEEKDC
jgi:hypothetical protein